MMSKHPGSMSFLEEQWLQDLVEKVGRQLHARKEKDLLLYEIGKRATEIEHIQDRIAIARGELGRTNEAIEALQRQLNDSAGESERLQVERQREEEKFSRLKAASKDVEKKLAALPQMREDIKRLEGEVRRSARRLEALRSDHVDILHRKEGLEDVCKASRTRIADVEQEISVMKSTFTLLTGQRPEDFDPETFEAVYEDLEKKVDEFTREMTEEIEKVKEQILSMQVQLEEKMDGRKALLLKKGQIQEVVRGLKRQVDGESSPEAIEAELERLEKERQRIEIHIEERKTEIRGMESAIDGVMKRVRLEEASADRLGERHVYLKTRKEEMARFGNVAEEIRRLWEETGRLMTISRVNGTLHETVREQIGDLEPFNRQIGSALQEYRRRFSEYEKEIKGIPGNKGSGPAGRKADRDA